jgi:hypothetical protein
MRKNDEHDQLRHFTPLLRRIVVIVALLTAAPVVLWSITAFVRSYVGPPQTPTFRRLAAPLAQPPDNAGANQDGGDQASAASQALGDSNSPAPTIEARATSTDARGAPSAADGQATPPQANPANVSAMMPSVATDATAKADRFIDRVPPDLAAPTGALASNQPAATDAAPADAMPGAEPLRGPIPLPRQRPRIFAMAQLTATPPGPGAHAPGGVPMPRPRPGVAGPPAAAEQGSQSPLGFIQGLFQQQ